MFVMENRLWKRIAENGCLHEVSGGKTVGKTHCCSETGTQVGHPMADQGPTSDRGALGDLSGAA